LEEKSPASMPMNNDSFAIELDHGDIMLECFLNYANPNKIPAISFGLYIDSSTSD
jgi:hypothetical protein